MFPHVGHLLMEHWEEPDFPALIDHLLNQEPERQGFPISVIHALRSLALQHDLEFM
jgi:hypothetical protein